MRACMIDVYTRAHVHAYATGGEDPFRGWQAAARHGRQELQAEQACRHRPTNITLLRPPARRAERFISCTRLLSGRGQTSSLFTCASIRTHARTHAHESALGPSAGPVTSEHVFGVFTEDGELRVDLDGPLRGMLHVACCMLRAACCMVHDACCMLYGTCCVLHVA